MRLLLIAVLIGLGCAARQPASSVEAAVADMPRPALKAPQVRLPPGAAPIDYALSLKVVPGEERFSGSVNVKVRIDRPLEVLWVNSTDLTLTAKTLVTERGARPADAIVVNEHFAAIVPRCPVTDQGCLIAMGEQSIELSFSGVLSKKDVWGLFQLKENNAWYAYTSFEPIYARRAFPHFDEPQFKVPWTLSLIVKEEQSALANTPVVGEEKLADGLKRVSFAKSPPMPSYLVAFAVGTFDFVDAGTFGQKKTPIRIVTPKGKGNEAAWAASTSGPILEQLEAYFGTPYPYEKLDQLALPAHTGAMENPGLVTYGHQTILAKPDRDNPTRQRSFAGTCTHELAHQWFGDLVTMAWWDDLWLNEAFATWATPRILEKWQPSWAQDVARVGRRNDALRADSLVSARQIRQPIESNDDIVNAFDGITYSKGASVINMFESFVGPEAFQKGVRLYLQRHAWKNATAGDFLGAIAEATGKNIGPSFRTFLDQPGAPIVSMQLSCGAKGASVSLSQRRALPIGSKGDSAKTWDLPVCIRWSTKGKQASTCTQLSTETATLELPGAKACPDWVLPNDDYTGYYRASVTGPITLVDVYQRANKTLPSREKAGLLGDVYALVRSGDLDASALLELAEIAAREDDRHVLGFAMSFAEVGRDDVLPELLRPRYQAFVRKLFAPRLSALGFDPKPGETEDQRLLRPQLIGVLGWHAHDSHTLEKARELAENWLGDRRAVHPDIADVVLALAGESADAIWFDRVTAAAQKEPDRADRVRLLRLLAETPDRSLVKKQLPLVVSDALEAREAMTLLWGAADDFRTRDLALQFAQEHWEELIARLPREEGARLVMLASSVCDEQERDRARAFFDGRSTVYLGGPRTFATVMERIDLCIAWKQRHQPSLAKFFEGHAHKVSSPKSK